MNFTKNLHKSFEVMIKGPIENIAAQLEFEF